MAVIDFIAETEVSDLEDVTFLQHDVLWFQVPMDDPFTVNVRNCKD